jgi:hypothetical protein
MKLLVTAILGAVLGTAALLTTTSTGSAADGCGRGRYWNGYGCAPMRAHIRPRYGRDAIAGQNSFGDPEVWFRPHYGYGATCPRGFTVQDGVCKRYRGY